MNRDDGTSAAALPLGRREFLKFAGPGLFLLFTLDDFAQEQRGGQRSYPDDINAYLRIGEDGRVTGYSGKIEMGQANTTALAQMLAEELEVPLTSVDMVMGDTRLCPWDGGTNGSRSIKYFGPALRAAAAEAREILIQLAAEKLQIAAAGLTARNGFVYDTGTPSKRISYGALTAGRKIERRLGKKPELKTPQGFRVCGKSLPRKDGRDKVTGKGKYAGDIRLPGMLYAAVLRPPAHGAEMKSVNTSAAASVKGVRVIEAGDLVAVLCPAPDIAVQILSRVTAEFKAPEAKIDHTNIQAHLKSLPVQDSVIEEKGNPAAGRELAALQFEETYFTPYIAHAPMETHTATADVSAGEATVWVSTQRPFGIQEEIARAIGMPLEKVRVITPYVGGGFGGKSQGRQAIEAARLSQLAGVPIQVAWSREEEFFYDTFRPAAFVKISSGLDRNNRIVFWDYRGYFAGERSSQNIYDIPHFRTSNGGVRGAQPHPFPTGAWRGPGSNTNIFARESHIDTMATKVEMDPVEFRRKNLSDARMIRVLNAAAEKFRWTPAKAPSGRGYGVTILDYLGSYVAAMAEVAVDPKSGKVTVKRVAIAQDMGQVINPEGAQFQMEGCVIMGLSSVLTEEIRFRGGEIKDRNFDTYEITRLSWVPEIETVLVDNPALAPQGCGEPAVTCMAALIANAVFDATGVRFRDLPLSPERVRQKLAK